MSCKDDQVTACTDGDDVNNDSSDTLRHAQISTSCQTPNNAVSSTTRNDHNQSYITSEDKQYSDLVVDDDDGDGSNCTLIPSVKVEVLSDDETSFSANDSRNSPLPSDLKSSKWCSVKEEHITSEPIIEFITNESHEENLSCEICSLVFDCEDKLNKHCLLHTNSRKNQNASKEGNFPFECHICGKGFMRKQAVKYHYIIHTDEKPHVCHICQKAYRHRSALYKHKRSHSEPIMHPCEVCGKLFKNKSYLSIHAVIHTHERPFSCDICGSTFRDRSARNKHVHAHSGVKPYSCEVCGKCFGRKGDYKSHLVVHTEERPYVCSVCGRGFRSSSNCRRHSRIHTNHYPYKCDECGKAFNQNWKLKEHRYVHSKEMPHVCDQCGVGFRYSRKLKQHMENHARERLHSQELNSTHQQEESEFEIIDVQPDISALIG